MAELIKRVDLMATFSRMKIGDKVEFAPTDATENSIRVNVTRFNKRNKVELKVSAPLGANVTVYRQS